MRKDKKKIQLLLDRIDMLEEENNKLSEGYMMETRRIGAQSEKLRFQLDEKEEKYTQLLEKYTALLDKYRAVMERMVKLDEQN